MQRHAVLIAFVIKVMKKIMIARNKRNFIEGQFNQLLTEMIKKPQFKLSLAELGIPVDSIE